MERSVDPDRLCSVQYRVERILAHCTLEVVVHTSHPSDTLDHVCIHSHKDQRGLAVLGRRRIGLRTGGVGGQRLLSGCG